MPQIRIKELVKRYEHVEVIHGLDLTFEDNEFTVLVGPSGCGKSTTLRMIAGLERVSSGDIYIGDREVSQLEPRDRDLAMVFQDYALYPHMNVEKNLSFALRLAKVDKAEIAQRVRSVSEMLGLDHLLHRKPGELSGGQRQRVAMGRALARDASTLLMDEPLSNLDAKLRAQMRAELILMRKKVNKNIIYVTHDQIEAMTLGDRIVVMNDGYVQQHGTPEELFCRPVNKFVAGFMGSPSMNFLSGEVRQTEDGIFIDGDGFQFQVDPVLEHKIKQLPSSSVYVGVRPSSFSTKPLEHANKISLPVLVTEYCGSNSIIVSEIGGNRVAIEVTSECLPKRDEYVDFYFKYSDLYIFDAKTEKALYPDN
ncbi:Glycerol-3-phosphate ABC transporter, ATP-binding protein UgpC [Grimontia indica]|uniref:Glycerol-3-phosphate ABC transporter, ATP-binding protein UgpC n=1 Tax=Grimontia indica TaxID=1056512 RepID=R1IT83_9GAMM|nr:MULTISPECIES: sn-glycerol-3-phosphate ABC transporter ATP-binding protein UgpC [Grimontia]EOD80692.1 Glycerol-3-phosphate ABC transporter, ATP-binding protein UgpC [Grimontia indica]